MANKEIKRLCIECGEECIVDTKLSTKEWKVYKQIPKCPCGGSYKFTNNY